MINPNLQAPKSKALPTPISNNCTSQLGVGSALGFGFWRSGFDAIVSETTLDPEQRREAIGQAAIGQREAQVEGDQHPRRDVALHPEAAGALQDDSLTNWMSSSVTLPATPVRTDVVYIMRGELMTRWPNRLTMTLRRGATSTSAPNA